MLLSAYKRVAKKSKKQLKRLKGLPYFRLFLSLNHLSEAALGPDVVVAVVVVVVVVDYFYGRSTSLCSRIRNAT